MQRSNQHGDPSTPEGDDRPLVAIVDDDASVRRSTRRLILSLGYRAETFAGGDEFLGSPHAQTAGCLIADMRMPGMDGLELQRSLAERGARIPIVFLTGRASDEEERQAWQAGAVAFLRKPVGKADLLRVLREVLPISQPIRGDADDD